MSDFYGTFDVLRAAFADFVARAAADYDRAHGRPRGGGDRPRARRHHGGVRPRVELCDGAPGSSSAAPCPSACGGPKGCWARSPSACRACTTRATGRRRSWPPCRRGCRFTAAQAALARFAGVTRRFEYHGQANGVTFVDDYAHLPAEVHAALGHRPDGRVGPHRRGLSAAPLLTHHGAGAQIRVCLRRRRRAGGDGRLQRGRASRARACRAAWWPTPSGTRTRDFRDLRGEPEGVRQTVGAALRPGDLCLALGAGDLTPHCPTSC